VLNTLDHGPGSLRDAIAKAASGDSIIFDPVAFLRPTTIRLTSGELYIAKDLTITGPTSISSNLFSQVIENGLTISGNHTSRVFAIHGTVTISGLTIADGSADDGGGIGNDGTLTVRNCTLATNFARISGGGIANPFGTLTVNNCTLTGNSAQWGGGISNDNTLIVSNSTLAGNSAGYDGGGIDNDNGTLTVSNCTLAGNSAGSSGGGIDNDGRLTVTNSTLAGNSAGIAGGGIDNPIGALTVSNCTLAGNSAGQCGGGIEATWVTLRNTIVAGNHAATTGPDVNGNINSIGYNLIQLTQGAIIQGPAAGDIYGLDPLLGPLQNNFGPTQTMLPGPLSPALGAGNYPSGAPATDQRGLARIINGRVDIGAVEVQTVPTRLSVYADTVALANQPLAVTVSTLDANGSVVPGYRGTVQLTGPDGVAVSYTFTAADYGSHTFAVTLRTPGHQTLQVTDALDSFSSSMAVSVLTDVSGSVSVQKSPFVYVSGRLFTGMLTITNTSSAALAGPFQILLGLPAGTRLATVSLITTGGTTIPLDFTSRSNGDPVITIPTSVLPSLASGSSFRISVTLNCLLWPGISTVTTALGDL
jgi:hypothetical protein